MAPGNASTLKIFRTLNDTSLAQKVTPDGRSLGFLAWHITLSLGETGERAGLTVASPAEDAPMPNNAHEIVDAYQSAAQSIADQVQKHWNDAALVEEVKMFGAEMETRLCACLAAYAIKHTIEAK